MRSRVKVDTGRGRVLYFIILNAFANQLDQQMRKTVDAEYATDENKTIPNGSGLNIIRQILKSSLPDSEKEYERVARECSSVTLAGTETTGSYLSFTTFLLLEHKAQLRRLRTELENCENRLGRKPSYQDLKELPYLVSNKLNFIYA